MKSAVSCLNIYLQKAAGSCPALLLSNYCIFTTGNTRYPKIRLHSYRCANGFKYIGEQITLLENKALKIALFSGLKKAMATSGTHVRDKDAVGINANLRNGCIYKAQGKTLFDVLTNYI